VHEHFILACEKEDPRIARKIVHDHKNIPLPTRRTNPGRTNCVHMKQLTGAFSHHQIDWWVRSSNHLPVTTGGTDEILLKLELRQSSDQAQAT
jgi:hypothetical protein